MINNNISEILCKAQLYQHDFEDQINVDSGYLEEPKRSTLDVYATFHLSVKKQTVVSSKNKNKFIC